MTTTEMPPRIPEPHLNLSFSHAIPFPDKPFFPLSRMDKGYICLVSVHPFIHLSVCMEGNLFICLFIYIASSFSFSSLPSSLHHTNPIIAPYLPSLTLISSLCIPVHSSLHIHHQMPILTHPHNPSPPPVLNPCLLSHPPFDKASRHPPSPAHHPGWIICKTLIIKPFKSVSCYTVLHLLDITCGPTLLHLLFSGEKPNIIIYSFFSSCA